MKILFVNACMRGPEHSRTWKLCQAFLDACRARWPQAQITERDLTACDWPVLSAALAAERAKRFRDDPQDPLFAPARELVQADLILVGAPYWDLAFPAALEIYLEGVS